MKGLRLVFAFMATLTLLSCQEKQKTVSIIVKTPTIHIKTGENKFAMATYQFLLNVADAFMKDYKKCKVQVNVVGFSPQDEKLFVTDCFDTENAADVLYESTFNMASYVYTGRVVSLNDMLTEKMKEDIAERMIELGSIDGKLYMMPFFSLQNVLCYNKDLFLKAGLDRYVEDRNVIQHWTLEDCDIILSTLRKKLPADVYPALMYAKNEQGDTHILTLLRSQGSNIFDEEGLFCLSRPEGVAALKWIKDNYDKGYNPPNCEALEIENCRKLFELGKLALFITNNQLLDSFFDLNLGFANFPSPDGEGYATSFNTSFCAFDNGDEEKIKVAKDFIKYIYETDFIDHSTTSIPASRSVIKKYKEKIFMIDEFYKNSKNIWDYTGGNPNWRGVRSVFYKHIQELFYDYKDIETIAKELDEDCNRQIMIGRKNSKLHD